METGRQSRQKTESQRMRLAEAITNGRLYQTKMILTDITNLNYLDDEGLSPLMRAFMIEDIKHRTRSAMVRLLIHHNADVNLRDKYGQNVLNWACKMNKFDLVKLLLEKCLQDVDLTSQDLQGNTALIYAVINNNVNMVKLLVDTLKKFALSVDHRNKQDKTAYLKALEMGFNECATILSQVGKASQDIRANPFLDFLPIPNKETSKKVRVRSAPLVKEYGSIRRELSDSNMFMVNRKNARVNDPLFDGNRTYIVRNKKPGNRLFKSRKIHSAVSRKTQNENSRISSHAAKTQNVKAGKTVKTFVGDKIPCSTLLENDRFNKNAEKESLSTSTEETQAVKKDPFLRILLDESRSQTSSPQHSRRSSESYTSCSQTDKKQSSTVLPTVNGFFQSKKVRSMNTGGLGQPSRMNYACLNDKYSTTKLLFYPIKIITRGQHPEIQGIIC